MEKGANIRIQKLFTNIRIECEYLNIRIFVDILNKKLWLIFRDCLTYHMSWAGSSLIKWFKPVLKCSVGSSWRTHLATYQFQTRFPGILDP